MVNEVGDITETTGAAWVTPVHDAAGNMTTVPKPADPTVGLTCTFDAWNRLARVEQSGSGVAYKYEYGGLNRRIVVCLDSPSLDLYMHFYYNASWQVLEMRDTTGGQPEGAQPDYQYVWSARYIDAPVLRDKNTDSDGLCDDQRLYYLGDANFNVTTLVDTAGDAVERYVYDPYGKVTIYTGGGWSTPLGWSAYANRIRYTGRQYDVETGFYHYRNRYYTVDLARFISRDPVQAPSLYLYGAGNPVNDLDPYGELSRKECEKKLDSLRTHIEELEDHYSRYHCGAMRSVLDTFLSGGCRQWAKSFKDRLDDLEDFYQRKCKCPQENQTTGHPFSGLELLLKKLGGALGVDLSGLPVVAFPAPVVPLAPPGAIRPPIAASPAPIVPRRRIDEDWSERLFRERLESAWEQIEATGPSRWVKEKKMRRQHWPAPEN